MLPPNSTLLLNALQNSSPTEGEGLVLHRTKNLLKAIYDFTVNGGVVGTIPLVDDLGNPAILPPGALITRSWAVVAVACTGATATLACQAQAAGDVLAATAVASLTLAAIIEGKATGTAANFSGPVTGTTAGTPGKQVSAVIATANLTAGKVAFYMEYVF